MIRHEAAWARELVARYNSPSLASMVEEDWEAVMDGDLGNWTNTEVVSALRWSQSRDGGTWKIANVNDLVKLYRTHKKWERETNDDGLGSESMQCNLCSKGWLIYYPDWQGPLDKIPAHKGSNVMIPCSCQEGRRVGKTVLSEMPGCDEAQVTKYWASAQVDAKQQVKTMEAHYAEVGIRTPYEPGALGEF